MSVRVYGVDVPLPLCAGHNYEGCDNAVVDENGGHDASGLHHAVEAEPGTVVLMEVPALSRAEALLRVEAALMEIHVVAQKLAHGKKNSGQACEPVEGLGKDVAAENEKIVQRMYKRAQTFDKALKADARPPGEVKSGDEG